jgi:hypothetical protein
MKLKSFKVELAADSLILPHIHYCCKTQTNLLIKRIKLKIKKIYICQELAGGSGQVSFPVVGGGSVGVGGAG